MGLKHFKCYDSQAAGFFLFFLQSFWVERPDKREVMSLNCIEMI